MNAIAAGIAKPSGLESNQLFQGLRRHSGLFDAAQHLAKAYVDYVDRWPTMRTYIKDQAALALATVAVAQTVVGPGYTAGQFATVLSATGSCSERRAVSMTAAMQRRGDLVPSPAQEETTRAQFLAASEPVCAFVFDRLRLEAVSAARLSPLVRANLPVIDSNKSHLYDLTVYARARFLMAYQQNDPVLEVAHFYLKRDFGLYFLMFLLARAERDGDGAKCRLQISDAARQLGVSRAHVRMMITLSHDAALMDWDARASELRLKPALVRGAVDFCTTMFMAIIEGLQQRDWASKADAL